MANTLHPIIGVWYVHIIGAPFEHHMLTFHADGTMLQSNPDAGNAQTSDSLGMGLWQADGNTIRAKFVETSASRDTHQFVARGEITLQLTQNGNSLTGTASATFYNKQNSKIKGPTHETVQGWRVTLDQPTLPDHS